MSLSPDKQALKRATGRLVKAVGGQEAAVAFTRLHRHQVLSDYANPAADHAERFAPIDVIADLEGITHGTAGHPVVTRALARAAGFALVPLPAARCAVDDLGCHLSAIIRESADVTLALSLALSRPLADAGRAALRREIAEAVQALVELDAALAGAGE